MYLSFYQLERKPFQISTDPKFLWLGEKHREALAVFRYGLMDNKGFLLLTGDVGTGKTTLIHALVNTLGENIIATTLLDPGIDKIDFFTFLGNSFQLDTAFTTKGDFIQRFTAFLNQAYDRHKKVLLIIDESQRLSQELLEEIRLLSNIEKQSSKLINIFFVGQIEFNSIILEPKNSALRQRISVNYDLQPLSAKETGQYVHHRLKIAGASKPIFNAAAIREIFRFSNGYPRLINVICDRALVTGFTQERKKIGPAILKECARELKLQNQKSRFKKKKSAPKQDDDTQAVVAPTKGAFVEKLLYVILAVLILAWIAIAIYYYTPLGKSVSRPSTVPQVESTLPNPEPHEDSERPPPSAASSETVIAGAPESTPSKPGIDSDKFQIPDKHVVIRIDFDANSEISQEGIETLDNLSAVLLNHPELQITIKGYSESQGSYRYNKKMSEFTANIVKGYLVGKRIAAQRVEAVGMWLINSDDDTLNSVPTQNRQWVEIQFKDL